MNFENTNIYFNFVFGLKRKIPPNTTKEGKKVERIDNFRITVQM
jgi:hypothetical protein